MLRGVATKNLMQGRGSFESGPQISKHSRQKQMAIMCAVSCRLQSEQLRTSNIHHTSSCTTQLHCIDNSKLLQHTWCVLPAASKQCHKFVANRRSVRHTQLKCNTAAMLRKGGAGHTVWLLGRILSRCPRKRRAQSVALCLPWLLCLEHSPEQHKQNM